MSEKNRREAELPPVFNPVRELAIAGETVLVKELSWPDALAFFNKLRDQAKGLTNEKGELSLDATRVLDAIGENVQLATWLVQKCALVGRAGGTGVTPVADARDAHPTTEWIEQRSLSEMLDVVAAALEINLGVIANRLKNVRSRLATLATGAETTGKSSQTSPPSAT